MLPKLLRPSETIGEDGETAFFKHTHSLVQEIIVLSFPFQWLWLIKTMDKLSTSNALRAHVWPRPGHFSAVGHSRSGGV